MSWVPRPEDHVFKRVLRVEWFTGCGAGICIGATFTFFVVLVVVL